MRSEQISENLRQQSVLYGEPLGQYLSEIMQTLRITQARTAAVLGLSAPMLSQLMSGQRVKIGNPLVVQRLRSLGELAATASSGMTPGEIDAGLDEIKGEAASVTTVARRLGSDEAQSDPPVAVHRLLRAVASGRELLAAAERLEADYPEIAEVLRTYGTGDPAQAKAHYASVEHLL